MIGRSSGKDDAMTLRNSVREIELNMLVRSRNIAARVGGSPADCLLVIYFSMARWMELMIVSLPFGIPTA